MAGTPFDLYSWTNGDLPTTNLQIRLYQSGPPFVDFPALADFVEASFPGYGAQFAESFMGKQQAGNGFLYYAVNRMLFAFRKGNALGCVVNGWYATSLDLMQNELVACWATIEPAVHFENEGDFVVIEPTWSVKRLVTPATNP